MFVYHGTDQLLTKFRNIKIVGSIFLQAGIQKLEKKKNERTHTRKIERKKELT